MGSIVIKVHASKRINTILFVNQKTYSISLIQSFVRKKTIVHWFCFLYFFGYLDMCKIHKHICFRHIKELYCVKFVEKCCVGYDQLPLTTKKTNLFFWTFLLVCCVARNASLAAPDILDTSWRSGRGWSATVGPQAAGSCFQPSHLSINTGTDHVFQMNM